MLKLSILELILPTSGAKAGKCAERKRSCTGWFQAGRQRCQHEAPWNATSVNPEFLKMFACDSLLKFLLKSVDFESFLAKSDQVPISAP